MKNVLLASVVVGVWCAASLQAAPVTYMGKLAAVGSGGGDGDLIVSGDWVSLSHPATLNWKVTGSTTSNLWHYEYTIKVPNTVGQWADIQCVIVEASDGTPGPKFTFDDLLSPSASPAGWIQGINVGLHSPTDNPNLPRNLYGIKFCTSDIDPTTLTLSFDTARQPVWGDFYARSYALNSQFSSLYNGGLMGMPETDPTDDPSNGSIDDHVLVPDSVAIPPIPAPGAILLGMVGVPLAGLLRRKLWI